MAAAPTAVTVRVIFNRLPAVSAAIESGITREVAKAAHDVQAAAQAKVPVRTGLLRRSIHTVMSNNGRTAVVGPSVDYGIYVELGTRHMAARPYMRPAAELVAPRFADALRAVLRGG